MHKIGNSRLTNDAMRSNASVNKLTEELAISRQHQTCGDLEPWEDCPKDSKSAWRKLAERKLLEKEEKVRE